MTIDSNASEFPVSSTEALERVKLAKEIALLDRQLNPPPFPKAISTQLTGQFFSIVNPILVVFLTFLSTFAIDRIKGREAAKQERIAYFQNISKDFGSYTFLAELEAEFIGHNWTSLDELSPITTEYNRIVEGIRNDEFKNKALIRDKFGATAEAEFVAVMQDLRAVDNAVHGLNDETGRLIRAKGDNSPGAKSMRADPKIAAAVASEIRERLVPFRQKTQELIGTISSKL